MRATPEMRRVRFTLYDRLVLAPVEIANEMKIASITAAATVLVAGVGSGWFSISRMVERAPIAILAIVFAMLAGTLLTPLLLPWVPGRMFAVKGAVVGALAATLMYLAFPVPALAVSLAAAAVFIVAGSSFAAMNFTGTSTYTSLHGVEKEMRLVMPWQALGALIAAALWIAGGWF